MAGMSHSVSAAGVRAAAVGIGSPTTAVPRYLDDGARRRRQRLADLGGGAALLGGGLLIALWVLDGGVQSLTGVAGWWTGTGRVTGLLCAYLLLVQVLLMARIPWLERVWGQDTLTRRHRWVGFGSFTLMLVHIVAITLGYAATAQTGVWHEAWVLVTIYPGMLLAAAGTLCLIAVVVTSLRAARRRLRYETWHLIHLYAYLGVGLALPHQLWTGADFTESGGATALWWTAWGLAVGAILGFRVALPVARSIRHRLTVERVVPEAPGVVSVWLKGKDLDRLGLSAGQFCQWRFLGPGWTRANPFTVSAAPSGHRLRITLRVDGPATRRIAGLRPGTPVLFEGPYGVMTAHTRRQRDVLLIGAGVGVTPLRGIAEDVLTEPPSPGPGGIRPPSVVLLHRIRDRSSVLFSAEFGALAAHSDLRVIAYSGRRDPRMDTWLGPAAPDPASGLLGRVPDLAAREVYLCGPAEWMSAARRTLIDLGVSPTTIHAEVFSW
jgi:predicted ferric reductase